MTTALAERPQTPRAILYSVTAETIAAKSADLLALKIHGIDDEAGIATVKAKLKEVVGWRTAVEKTREEAKKEYLEAGRRVDAEAKAIQELIAPIERHLAGQKKLVDDELARIAKAKADEVYAVRLKRLQTIEADRDFPEDMIRSMSESVFEVALEQAAERTRLRKEAESKRLAEEAERKRLAEEEAERNRAEKERLAAERAELDRQRQEQEAERKRQQAAEDEKRAAEQAERNRLKAIEDERLAAERAELERQRAEIQAEKDRLAREREEREAAERAAAQAEREAAEQAAAAARAEKLKPVKDKIGEFANKVRIMALPDIPDDIAGRIDEELYACADRIEAIGKGLK